MKTLVKGLVAGLLCLAGMTPVSRAQFVWTGNGANDNVSLGANWQGGVAPTGVSGTDDLSFDAPGGFAPAFTSAFTVRNIILPGNASYNMTGSGPLTLNGNITTGTSEYATTLFGVPMTIAAGTHTFDIEGIINNSVYQVYLFNDLSGTGNIVKTGGGMLIFDHSGNDARYSGNIDLQNGKLVIHGNGALGSGTLMLHGGVVVAADYYTDNHISVLPNSVTLSASNTFGDGGQGSLQFTGSSTTIDSGVSTATITVNGTGLVTLPNVTQTDAGTAVVVNGGGNVRFSGTTTYTGDTTVADNSVLVFAGGPPSTGTLFMDTGGFGDNFDNYIGTENTTNLQANFINHFDTALQGIIGFDSPDQANPLTFSGSVDISGFSHVGEVLIGSSTAAIFSGSFTPGADQAIHFGGRGVLYVTSSMAMSGGITASNGIQVFLTGNNTYGFGTTALTGGAIVFDGPNALPASANLLTYSGGYIGETESTGLTAAQFLSKFDTSTSAVIGFDAHDPVAGRTVSENIDLSGFNNDPYIGTSTKVTLTGTITEPNSTYYLTAFRNGSLTVNSTLSGSGMDTVIGLDYNDVSSHLPAQVVTFHPTVTLNAANTYDGGTAWLSGDLILGNSAALGTGALDIETGSSAARFSTNTPSLVIPNDVYFGNYFSFELTGALDYELSGVLTSDGGYLNKTGINTVTLSGDNSGFDQYITVVSGTLRFTSDTAAGTGGIHLQNFDGSHDGEIVFTSANPSMGSLSGDDHTVVNFGSGNLTLHEGIYGDPSTLDETYNGTFIGTGNLTIDRNPSVSNAVSLTLNNTSPSYSGTTTIRSGVVVVVERAGALGTGGIVLDGGSVNPDAGVTLTNPISFSANGGTISGNGTFGAPVTIGTNVVLSPGNSPGLLTFNAGTTWAGGGNYSFQLQSTAGARGVGYDSIDVTGGLNFTASSGSPFTIYIISLDGSGNTGQVADFTSSSAYSFIIAHTDGLTGFTMSGISLNTAGFQNSQGTGSFYVTTSGNDILLNFTPVPEPGTYALLGLGLVGWLIARRRSFVK